MVREHFYERNPKHIYPLCFGFICPHPVDTIITAAAAATTKNRQVKLVCFVSTDIYHVRASPCVCVCVSAASYTLRCIDWWPLILLDIRYMVCICVEMISIGSRYVYHSIPIFSYFFFSLCFHTITISIRLCLTRSLSSRPIKFTYKYMERICRPMGSCALRHQFCLWYSFVLEEEMFIYWAMLPWRACYMTSEDFVWFYIEYIE